MIAASRLLLTALSSVVLGFLSHASANDLGRVNQPQSDSIQKDDYSINVISAERVIDDKGTSKGIKLTFNYTFNKSQHVEIPDLGVVPASGHFSYITKSDKLVINDTEKKSAIVMVLHATRPAEGSSDPWPELHQFAGMGFDERRIATTNFPVAINDIFNKIFLSGYEPLSKGERSLIYSSYTDLPDVPSNLEAQIAVLLTYVTGTASPPIPFHIQYLVRQRPAQSESWSLNDLDDIKAPVQKWLNNFIEALKTQ